MRSPTLRSAHGCWSSPAGSTVISLVLRPVQLARPLRLRRLTGEFGGLARAFATLHLSTLRGLSAEMRTPCHVQTWLSLVILRAIQRTDGWSALYPLFRACVHWIIPSFSLRLAVLIPEFRTLMFFIGSLRYGCFLDGLCGFPTPLGLVMMPVTPRLSSRFGCTHFLRCPDRAA